MARGQASTEWARRDLATACTRHYEDQAALRASLLHHLRRAVPFDAAFHATCDPRTLLFTTAWADTPLRPEGPRFLESEFAEAPDVNRFADLARASDPVATLDLATHGRWSDSSRFREIMAPLGLGDELRVALRSRNVCWGFLCLHREGSARFSTDEIEIVRHMAPHAAEAVRRLVAESLASTGQEDQGARPGAPVGAEFLETGSAVIIVADRVADGVANGVEDGIGGGTVLAVTDHAAACLESIGIDRLAPGDRLPMPLLAIVRRLEAIERGNTSLGPAAATLASRGRALVDVHAARLRSGSGGGAVSLVFTPSGADVRSSLRLAAWAFTLSQQRVAELTLRGLSTKEMSTALHITEATVQDHLKAVFRRAGVTTRRELIFALTH